MNEGGDPAQRALLAKIAAGDLEAWGILWADVAPHVLRFAAKWLDRPIDDADVEDVASETSERVRIRAGTYAGRSKVLTWVIGIAKYVLLEKTKELERAKELLPIDEAAEPLSPTPGLDEGSPPVPLEEMESLYQALLGDLPPAQRQAHLRDQGYSDKKEAREGLRGREAVVHRQNVHRARQSMMERIATDSKYEKLRPWLKRLRK